MITKVQTLPNTTDDASMLAEAMPDLVERTDMETIHTDGTYSSPVVDELCREHGVEQVQTAIRGASPTTDKFNLSDFVMLLDDKGIPLQITCPHRQTVNVQLGRQPNRFIANFAQTDCADCPPP